MHRSKFNASKFFALLIILISSWGLSGAYAGPSQIPVSNPQQNVFDPFSEPLLGDNFIPHLVPIASVTLNQGGGAVFLGSGFSLQYAFNNTSAIPTDVGYGPFIDLYFPATGADGADGVTYTPNSAQYSGANVTEFIDVFPDDDGAGPGTTGTLDHPLALDVSGQPIQVVGTAGDQLITLELPFGSVTTDFPTIFIDVAGSLSQDADVGTPLTIYARGGYRFGADPLNNPCCDQVIINPNTNPPGGWQATQIIPTVVNLAKSYQGPEGETATGPNFPRTFTITVNVANNQTITNLVIQDLLPNNIQYQGLNAATTAGCGPVAGFEPSTLAPQNPPNNELRIVCASVTGGSGTNDVQIVYDFFVPDLDANVVPVLDPITGDDVNSTNNADIIGGTWTPTDPGDTPVDLALPPSICPDCPGSATVIDKSIAIQKGVSVVGGGPPLPGAQLQYTLDFQISDYFTFDQVLISDTFSDGQRLYTIGMPNPPLIPPPPPTLTLDDRETGLAGFNFSYNNNVYNFGDVLPAFPAAGEDMIVDQTAIEGTGPGPDLTDGSTTLLFFIDLAMLNAGEANSILQGGEVGTAGNTAATGTITFYTIVQQDFSDNFPSGDPSVDQGDSLTNDVTVLGNILNNATQFPTGSNEADTSTARVQIPRGTLSKSIYAVNGAVPTGSPLINVTPGDEVTFRIRYDLPTTDFENLVLSDFLPKPIFDANDPDIDGFAGPTFTAFDTSVSTGVADVPPPGEAQFGPAAGNFFAVTSITPAGSVDATANSVIFNVGTFDDPGDTGTSVDILFTVTVTDLPFADQLQLTNLARVDEGSTNEPPEFDETIIQFILQEPFLIIKKGIMDTDSPWDSFTPSPPIPGGWTPGTPINSNNLTNVFDSDADGVDPGSLMEFAIAIENQGSGANGAFDIIIRDSFPAGFVIPVGGINLQIHTGDGTAVSHINLGPGGIDTDLFGTGIELVDPAGSGICQRYDPVSGDNIIMITYELQVDPLQPHGTQITNTATLENYAGTEGGPDFVGTPTPGVHTDDAVTNISQPDLRIFKDDNIQVVSPGETIIYNLTYDNVGTHDSFGVVISDTVSTGTTFDAANSTGTWYQADLPITNPPTHSGITCDTGTIAGTVCMYEVGDVLVGDPQVVVQYAVTVDDPLDPAVTEINNLAIIEDDGTEGPDARPGNNRSRDRDRVLLNVNINKTVIEITEPVLVAPPAILPNAPVAIGAIVTYQLEVEFPAAGSLGTISIDNVEIEDVLDQGLAFMDLAAGACMVESSGNLTTNLPGGFAAACAPSSGSPPSGNPRIEPELLTSTDDVDQGRRITFELDTITNANAAATETLTITYRAVVLDSADNLRGVDLSNTASITWDDGAGGNPQSGGPANAAPVTIIEPDLSLFVQVDQTVVIPSQVLTFTIDIAQTDLIGISDAVAYDALMTHTLPASLNLVPGSFVYVGGTAPAPVLTEGPVLRAEWATFPLGTTARLQYNVVVGFVPGRGIDNQWNLEWTSLPGLVDTPQSDFNLLSTERYFDPPSGINIYGVAFSILLVPPDVDRAGFPESGFAPGVETTLPPKPAGEVYTDIGDLRLEIPSLGVDVQVNGVPFGAEGWDITWLGDEAGYLAGTAFPTQPGNTFITGHVVDENGLPGVFANLQRLRWGDTFYITAFGQRYTYQVTDQFQTHPYDMSLLDHDAYDRVTLITCKGYNEANDSYRWRTVVQAVLVDVTVYVE